MQESDANCSEGVCRALSWSITKEMAAAFSRTRLKCSQYGHSQIQIKRSCRMGQGLRSQRTFPRDWAYASGFWDGILVGPHFFPTNIDCHVCQAGHEPLGLRSEFHHCCLGNPASLLPPCLALGWAPHLSVRRGRHATAAG